MKNAAMAKVFQDIADLLELKEENQFKIRAYQKAARAIENLPTPAEQLMREGRLRKVPGIGEAIEKKITELLTTGRLGYYDNLRAEFPEGISLLMEIPGIGPKTALRLSRELGISTIDELEKAASDGRIAALYRLGDKTADNILRRIQAMRRKDQRVPLGQALPVAEEILALLKDCPGVHNLLPVGSMRRFKETVGDIDIMGTASDPERVLQAFTQLPQVEEILLQGTTKSSVIVSEGLQVDLRIVEHDAFGSLLQYFTGSKEHNIALRERAVRNGLKLSEYGITTVKTGKLEKFATEEGYYERLGLDFIPPELREGRDEIEKAANRTIPKLIELSDIKGDLHVHTEWSDGQDSIAAMAWAAKERGYQYLAITDHSAGRGIAHGLDEERLRRQIAEIKRLNQTLDGIRLLSGIEVDIRADGSLDLSHEVLAELDIVIAAVHSAMGQDEAKMTQRVLRAVENPNVDILAHPTCRLLGEREPVNLDMEQVFKAALKTGTALEINAMPDRLDLKDIHVLRAKELGVKLVINTDAHRVSHLDLMRFGVGVARRGWCEAGDVLNTKPVEVWLKLQQ
jgi:DNA polymerase (family 10)